MVMKLARPKSIRQQKSFFGFLVILTAIGLFSATGPVLRTWSGMLIMSVLALLSLATVTALWMVLNFRLQSQKRANLHIYRMQLMKNLNIIQVDNGGLVDRKGKPIASRCAKKAKNPAD